MKPRFILPPHPSSSMKIRREDLPTYERMGKWIAQRKFNGTHVVIWIHEDKVMLWDRRGIPLTLYKLTPSMKNCLLSLKHLGKELVLAGELLHSKAKSKITGAQAMLDTIVLFDVLFHGDHLTQMNQVERLAYLSSLCGDPTQKEPGTFPGATARALIVREEKTAHLWLAEVFADEFDYHFDECMEESNGRDKYPEIEGLMLRLKDSRLSAGTSKSGDVSWLLRCRKFKENVYPW